MRFAYSNRWERDFLNSELCRQNPAVWIDGVQRQTRKSVQISTTPTFTGSSGYGKRQLRTLGQSAGYSVRTRRCQEEPAPKQLDREEAIVMMIKRKRRKEEEHRRMQASSSPSIYFSSGAALIFYNRQSAAFNISVAYKCTVSSFRKK
jgi:hypothetical protein